MKYQLQSRKMTNCNNKTMVAIVVSSNFHDIYDTPIKII